MTENYGRGRQAADDTIIWRTSFACRLNKAAGIHTEYEILTVFPWQQRLREQASMLCYVYISCLG